MRSGSQSYFWLTVLSLVGLMAVQSYFTISYFHQDSQVFEEELQTLVAQTIAEQELRQRMDLVESFELYLLDPEKVTLGVVPFWSGEGFTYFLQDTYDRDPNPHYLSSKYAPLQDTTRELTPEEMAAAFGEELLQQMETGNLYQWTPAIDEELFFWYALIAIDSAQLWNRMSENLQQSQLADTFQLFLADSVHRLPHINHDEQLATIPLPARVTGVERYVQVVLPNPLQRVFLRSLGVIGISLLIVLLAAFTFYRLFRGLVREKRLGELKDDFINNVTHELKTPLSTIRVALEAAQRHAEKHPVPPPSRDYLGIAMKETQHLTGMIDHLLQSRMLGREASIQPEPVWVSGLMLQVAESAQISHEGNLNLKTEGLEAEIWAMADPLHLAQIFHNLLDNAIKYADQDKVTVTFRQKLASNTLQLEVQDDGPGIAAEHCAHLFDRFFRVPQEREENIRGLGLGLYYVKNALQLMNGQIWVESEPGHGSTFFITLPLATHEDSLSGR
ncbi:MAG: HAMP domain-containing sensor histidine kinase [Bacteroidota bacterium]